MMKPYDQFLLQTKKLVLGMVFQFFFRNSKNCAAVISEKSRFFGSKIEFINSESSIVFIEESLHKIFELKIYSKYSKGGGCYIGKNFSCGSCMINFSENKHVTIGSDCMFSVNTNIWNWDGHTLLDRYGKCINHAESIAIGNHVWIGMDVAISKGAQIADNSVIGQRALVTRAFNEQNVMIAGVPARIIKTNISWDRTPSAIWEKNL